SRSRCWTSSRRAPAPRSGCVEGKPFPAANALKERTEPDCPDCPGGAPTRGTSPHRSSSTVAAVRALLALVFCLVGALIGYQLGLAYIGTAAVRQMLLNYPAARIPNLLGFTGLGLLLGLGMHQWMMRHITLWSDNLKKMPPDDKIVFIVGAMLGVFFTFL